MDILINRLQIELTNAADNKTKEWFENYLKGSIEYRGVKTPKIRSIVNKWYKEEEIFNKPLKKQLKLVSGLIAESKAEDKLTATSLLPVRLKGILQVVINY